MRFLMLYLVVLCLDAIDLRGQTFGAILDDKRAVLNDTMTEEAFTKDLFTTADTTLAMDLSSTEKIATSRIDDDGVEDKGVPSLDDYGDEVTQADIDDAANVGLKLMHELHFIKEPQLYKMGLFLTASDPGGRIAMFSTPNAKAQLQAKYGYAAVQATLLLRSKYPESRSRRNPEDVSFLRAEPLENECPIRGVPRCSPASRRYRTADGTCNNRDHPWRGASMLPMQRFLLPQYEDGVQEVRRSVHGTRLPSAREVSIRIHRDRDIEMSAITMMFMQWGQFLDHDITATAQSRSFNASIPRCCARDGGFLPPDFMHPECLPISVPEDDWFFNRRGMRCIEFIRSAPSSRIDCHLGWREQINQVTSYIDASMVYGSDPDRADSLRIFRNGLLQYGRSRDARQDPPDPPGGELCRMGALSTKCFKGGDLRVGEQPGLTAFHTVWLRYHNRLAAILGNLNSHWSDEKVYQEARRIVAANIQHITYKEFLPIVLGQEVMDSFGLNLERKGFYNGYNRRVNPAPANAFSSAAFRFGHSLVQNSYVRSDGLHRPIFNNVTIHEEQTNRENIWSEGSVDRLILGFLNQASQRRDEFICKELTNHLFQSPGEPFGMDLAAVNIQRGRDHGIPSYTGWREPCGLSPITSWRDLEPIMSLETIQRFRSIYEHVDDIDLYPGGLAEKPVRGGIVGPTFSCIIAQQFSNLRSGDRFWYENDGFESSFTPAQLQQLRRVTFSQVLCRVLPEIETLQPFVFLSPDNFRNNRISCGSQEMDAFDLRPWEERKNANLADRRFEEDLDTEESAPAKSAPVVDIPAKTFPIRNKPFRIPPVKSTTVRNTPVHGIDNKLSFSSTNTNSNPPIHQQLLNTQSLDSATINNKLSFSEEVKRNNSLDNRIQVSDKDDLTVDFDVLFFTTGVDKRKPEKVVKLEIKNPKVKRSVDDEEYYYEEDFDEIIDEIVEDKQNNEGRKKNNNNKKRKKKPVKLRATTSKPTTKRYSNFHQSKPHDPFQIKVVNVTTMTYDVSEHKKPLFIKDNLPNNFRPSNYYDNADDDRYVLHPTISKDNYHQEMSGGKPSDYHQVNINIQYVLSSTQKPYKPNRISQQTHQTYQSQQSQHNPQPHPQPHQIHSAPIEVVNNEYYIPMQSYIKNKRRTTTKRPSYYQSSHRPYTGYYETTKGPNHYNDNTYLTEYNSYRPPMTTKRPYRPSQHYDDIYTTKRPTYIYSYVEKVSKPTNIPIYLYLNNNGDKNSGYKQQVPDDAEYDDRYYSDYDRKADNRNFVKISSVHGNQYLAQNRKEQIINVAAKEGDLELDDGNFEVNTENNEVTENPEGSIAESIESDEDVEKLQVDIIPKQNRKEDWLIYNEINEDNIARIEEPLFPVLVENSTSELPSPLPVFWEKENGKKH